MAPWAWLRAPSSAGSETASNNEMTLTTTSNSISVSPLLAIDILPSRQSRLANQSGKL
jgi:hypothetical protein